jgi:hypothetical protein
MSLRRSRAEVVIDLPGLTRAQLLERVEAHRALPPGSRLWVRLRPDGSLRARPRGSKHHFPPLLTAQVSPLPAGVRVEGVARESLVAPITMLLLTGAVLLLAAVAVSVAGDTDRTGFVVCAIGAAALGGIALLHLWLRPRVFRSDLEELQERLPKVLRGSPT